MKSIISCLLISLCLLSACHTRKALHHTAPISSNKPTHQELRKQIEAWKGTPYLFGGNSKKGVDCSGFVCAIYQSVYQKKLPRTSLQQYQLCKPISIKQAKEGDLLFFKPGTKQVSHVGIYLGNNQFAHASSSKGVMISDLTQTYYQQCFVGAGRVP